MASFHTCLLLSLHPYVNTLTPLFYFLTPRFSFPTCLSPSCPLAPQLQRSPLMLCLSLALLSIPWRRLSFPPLPVVGPAAGPRGRSLLKDLLNPRFQHLYDPSAESVINLIPRHMIEFATSASRADAQHMVETYIISPVPRRVAPHCWQLVQAPTSCVQYRKEIHTPLPLQKRFHKPNQDWVPMLWHRWDESLLPYS